MKRLSLQWRMTLLTALLIACACICLNLLLYRSGATGMDSLGGYIMQYQPGDVEGLAIEIPDDQISDFLIHFSQEVCDAKALYGYKGWIITSVVTLLSAAIAYFVTGSALKPLGQFSRQAEKINQDSIATLRLDESTVREFQQLSRSVNQMLDRLAQSFDLQRQFAGNAAHELRTPLAILQTKLELFAEEHPDMDAETAELVGALLEQLGRLTSLVRTLLEMSNLLSVSRSDHIALAPLADGLLEDAETLGRLDFIIQKALFAVRYGGVRPELTERELEIAGLAAQRKSSREIAEILSISVKSVNNRLNAVYEKLGLGGEGRNKRQALAKLMKIS